MDTDEIPVAFAFSPTEKQVASPLSDLNPEGVMSRLLRLGFQFFLLTGLPGTYSELVNPTSHDVQLWIEPDVRVFLKAYLRLESLVATGSAWRHAVHMGDGMLQMSADCSDGSVTCYVERCPGLREIYLTNHTFMVSDATYLTTWRQAARQIQARAK